MTTSRRPFAVRFGVALFDYILVAVLAAIGSLWWLAAWLGSNSHGARGLEGCLSVVAGGTVLAVLVFWRVAIRRPWFAARYRRVVIAGAILAAGGLCMLMLRAFTIEAGDSSDAADAVFLMIFQLGVFLLCLVALFLLRRWALARGWLSVWSRTGLAVGAIAYGIYLGWDEPISPTVARNHAAMAGRSEDEATYLLTLRYSGAPGAAKVFTPPAHKLELGKCGEKKEKQQAYLIAHRAEIEANWAELGEVRAWWAEMAAQSEIGDRQPASVAQPIIPFRVIREYTQHALAIASLKALDGDGDGALAAVGDVYVVGAMLEPAACTLVRGTVARQIQRQAMETADFVLGHARVSPEARARFSALLDASMSGGAGAKRLVLIESAFWTKEMVAETVRPEASRPSTDWLAHIAQRVTVVLAPVVLNPQATANRMHDHCEQLARLAEARDLPGMDAADETFWSELFDGFQVKNLAGRALVRMGVPAYTIVVKSYWSIEDQRAALIERLREAPPTI